MGKTLLCIAVLGLALLCGCSESSSSASATGTQTCGSGKASVTMTCDFDLCEQYDAYRKEANNSLLMQTSPDLFAGRFMERMTAAGCTN
ncbi:hypothetical protein SAMN05720766_102211 [Fibrobacter sp. UWH9]|uniref:hypothetical protein n=1 Tax=unclassified Fibrobacter TaxID=2634177 RepID=UPI000922D359|nr:MULTISPECIES: hypothetical protein [Fibrobacter]MCQ2099259.1 hypothetical protein [Fibrobacter sp.]MCL4101023.1 hypothetical protein [Fibrobacter succinogenes]MDO4947035.1 hypothetical protein [Fibrobacter sp.]SHG52774.1 hypothetical protein SAMN05720766_102211 [Fibrobacter sp. UWH9]SHK22640.1 hypothetical protein SAMN05720765_101254 [Fibrobacter sp. UWH6]